MSDKKMKLTAALYKFFGRKPETQTLQEFTEEVKRLAAEDKAELLPLLQAELGREIEA